MADAIKPEPYYVEIHAPKHGNFSNCMYSETESNNLNKADKDKHFLIDNPNGRKKKNFSLSLAAIVIVAILAVVLLGIYGNMAKKLEKLDLIDMYLKQIQKTVNLSDQLKEISKSTKGCQNHILSVSPRDCSELYQGCQSGIYNIYPDNGHRISVYCDMSKRSGGWTVIQRRMNGTTSFYRTWDEYKQGFGDLSWEFWIGNENVHVMTNARNYSVRFNLEDFMGNRAFAVYKVFKVANETLNYQLHIDGYDGNAGDSFGKDDGAFFSTHDRDNDHWPLPCGRASRKGGWWYKKCGGNNINGPYRRSGYRGWTGIYWWDWQRKNNLQATAMSIKPV